MAVDFTGLSLVIAAAGVAVPSILTAVISVLAFVRQAQADRATQESRAKIDGKLDSIHKLADGQSSTISALSKAAGIAEGRIEGRDEERENPTAQVARVGALGVGALGVVPAGAVVDLKVTQVPVSAVKVVPSRVAKPIPKKASAKAKPRKH